LAAIIIYHGGVSLIDKYSWNVPEYEIYSFSKKNKKYCLCIPVINEGKRIINQLEQMQNNNINKYIDIIICDGNSTDGSTETERLESLNVNTLLIKKGSGKLSAQLRMGYSWALSGNYDGIITMDGNDKDNVGAIPDFVRALLEGYDMVQGSRYISGGKAINTPLFRYLAIKLIHIPIISKVAGFKYTDTTNGYRGYSSKYLRDERVQPFREIFDSYELLAYLSVRAPQLGYKTCEIPVERIYPEKGKIPTKISFIKGNLVLIKILWHIIRKHYDP